MAAALLALVAVSGCDAPTRPDRSVRIERVTVDARQEGDGFRVRLTATFPSDDGGQLQLSAPTLGSVSDVQVNGSPRSVSGERASVDASARVVAVDYVVHGALERYTDGVVATLPVWTAPGNANDEDQRMPIDAAITVGAAPAGEVHWHGASPAVVTTGGDPQQTIQLHGEVATTATSEVAFVLPADAAPDAPLLHAASRVGSFEDRQESADRADAQLADDLRTAKRREDLAAALYWGAVGLEIALPFVITLVVVLRAAAARRRATRDVPEELSEAPAELPPAVIALLHAEGHDIGAEATAATILDLAQRRAVAIESVSGERYTLRVVGSSAAPGESALLDALLGEGVVTGPPLPLRREGDWWRALRHDTVVSARSLGLLRRRFPSRLFVGAVIALGITTIPLYAESPETLVAGAVVSAILAALPFVGGYVLTAQGHRERARWEAYRRHLAGADLADVPASGVVVWEKGLVHAAALGLAEKAIGDLS
jgi:hypothetical protein